MPALALLLTLVVSAPNRDYAAVPVSVLVPGAKAGQNLVLMEGTREVPSQAEKSAEGTRLWFIVKNLKRGDRRTLKVYARPGRPAAQAAAAVQLTKADDAVEIKVDGQLFTRYIFTGAPKPYCYPVIGPTGGAVTRNFPMKKDVAGEPKDHPHQRSFWFTHGSVNGQDFWAETPKSSKTLHKAFEALESGPVVGILRTKNDWVGLDGKKVLEDVREMRIYDVGPDARLFDFEITLSATEGDVTFGDTKEGSLGFRMAATMQAGGGGQGHLENSAGQKDGKVWGKRADWCDYYGPVDGKTEGIAIFDNPENLRHPTYWHARDYGLFAVNPFGVKDFTGDKTADGKYVLPKGKSLTLRYRILIHKGTTAEAAIADRWGEYSDPPHVAVRAGR